MNTKTITNRMISILIAMAVLWMTVYITVKYAADEITAHAASEIIMGDLNGDKQLDVFDLALLKRKILAGDTASLTMADLNADGVVDEKDAAELHDFLHGLYCK